MNAAGHLTPAEAAAFVRPDGGLPPAERLAVSDHAAGCAACRSLLAESRGSAALHRVFVGLLEAGQQPPPAENQAPERWLGSTEFTDGTLPAWTPQEREELRSFQAHLNTFEAESFAPGGTLGGATTPAQARSSAKTPPEMDAWWQRLFSWPALSLAGAAAAVVLAAVFVLPRGGQRDPAGGNVAAQALRPDLVDGPVQVSASGALEGLTSVPTELRDAVLETIRRGMPPGALLDQVTRGGYADPAPQPAAGPSAVATPLSPVGTTIDADQPTFRWQLPPDSTTAVEVVVRPSAGGDEVHSQPLAPGTVEWTPSGTLARGALYRWQVVPSTPDGQAVGPAAGAKPGVVFKVLSVDAHARLEALRAGEAGRSHLTMGVAYAREGMRAESAREFRALERNNAQSALAKRLAASAGGQGG